MTENPMPAHEEKPAPRKPKRAKSDPTPKASRPLPKISAHDFVQGSKTPVLARSFLAFLRQQRQAGKPARKSGTRIEWEAEIEAFRNTVVG